MQLPPASNNPADITAYQSLMATQQAGSRALTDAFDVDALLQSYYAATPAPKPMYDEMEFPAAVGSQAELAIRGQLSALVDKAAEVLTEHCRDYTANDAERLKHGFGDKIRDAGLHNEERAYFYSRAFKATFERKVALAHRAAPDQNSPEMKELKNLCYLLNEPSHFFMAVVGKRIVQDFADNVRKALR